MSRRSWLALGFALGVVFCVVAHFLSDVHLSANGRYSRGTVTLYASRMESYADYSLASDHEWGHHLYETNFEKGDLKLWISIVGKCGYEGWNAPLYRSRSVKLEEEFADSFAISLTDGKVCAEKRVFVDKFK